MVIEFALIQLCTHTQSSCSYNHTIWGENRELELLWGERCVTPSSSTRFLFVSESPVASAVALVLLTALNHLPAQIC